MCCSAAHSDPRDFSADILGIPSSGITHATPGSLRRARRKCLGSTPWMLCRRDEAIGIVRRYSLPPTAMLVCATWPYFRAGPAVSGRAYKHHSGRQGMPPDYPDRLSPPTGHPRGATPAFAARASQASRPDPDTWKIQLNGQVAVSLPLRKDPQPKRIRWGVSGAGRPYTPPRHFAKRAKTWQKCSTWEPRIAHFGEI